MCFLKNIVLIHHHRKTPRCNRHRPTPLSRRLLSAERAALGEAGLTTGGLAEDRRAAGAHNDGLGVREDGGDVEAAGALDVHEEGTGSRHKLLKLVLAGLSLRSGVEKVDRENHLDETKKSISEES